MATIARDRIQRDRAADDAVVEDLLDHPSESERRALEPLPLPIRQGRWLDPLPWKPASFVQALVARGHNPRVFHRSSLGAQTLDWLWWLAEGPIFPVETRRIPPEDLKRLVSGPEFDVQPIWATYPQEPNGDVKPDPVVDFARGELERLYGAYGRGVHIEFPVTNERISRENERRVLEVLRRRSEKELSSNAKTFSDLAPRTKDGDPVGARKQLYQRALRSLKAAVSTKKQPAGPA